MLPEGIKRGMSVVSLVRQYDGIVKDLDSSTVAKIQSLVKQAIGTFRDKLPPEGTAVVEYLLTGEGTAQDRVMSIMADPQSRAAIESLTTLLPTHLSREDHARAIVHKGGLIIKCPSCETYADPYAVAVAQGRL